jgi:CBS-domain-containing membrane protein
MMGSRLSGACCRSPTIYVFVGSQVSVRTKGPATLEEMHAARPFGPGADAVALVLVIGDAVHRGGWFVAMMSCRRATRRATR